MGLYHIRMPYKDPEQYRKYQSEYRKKHRNKARESTIAWRLTDNGRNKILLRNYGITLDQYNEMLAKQSGVCAICLQPEKMMHGGKVKRLCVDHDHKTGKVRGILCHRCNTTLGQYEDNPELMRNLISYLESNFNS